MDENRANHAANRLAFWGALSASIGILLSGPLSLLLTMALAPQPPWQGPVVFAQHFHPLQQLAYLFGFPLIGGFVVLHAALPDTVAPARRPLARVALVITAVFASFICFNYVAQLAVVPALMTIVLTVVFSSRLRRPALRRPLSAAS